jgi:hypothetical protein
VIAQVLAGLQRSCQVRPDDFFWLLRWRSDDDLDAALSEQILSARAHAAGHHDVCAALGEPAW